MDISRINPALADYFVIATGFTTDHLLDMAEEIAERFGGRVEGNELSSWVLVDMGGYSGPSLPPRRPRLLRP